ncbi:efflux RND transporter permease subunit [Parvularcula dongshanensis]|uniref:Multidrug efflux pump subunit AcrB n=1 Tax=Parvularcula dongshanensis TaxID=1173995 RepID=A0A840I4M2_9PROT|nr:efflux RND transporter permease subunit [Parvularcula dongshanensis]MBB4659223.1 multidrug efflux pump subunit AcrB [Parvularcula dongshanensis]
MNGMIAWWARNGVAANLLMILIAIAGLFGFLMVDREESPSPAFNFVEISVSWPGAGPREVEEQIILRIEEAVSDVDGVKSVESTAREGYAYVTVEMVDDGRDFDAFLNQVKARVDAVSNLPPSSYPPVVAQQIWEQPLSFITFASDLPAQEHNRLAREIRDEIAALPGGTPMVSLWGARDEEVSIEVSEEALRRYGLTFDDVARAIRGSSINISAGAVRTDVGNIALAARNLADSQSEFEQIIVRQNQDGSAIRVSDVATVVDGFTEDRFRREVNGKPGITIAPRAPSKLNVVKISKVIEKYIEDKQEELPPGVDLFMTYDTIESYRSQLNLVGGNAVQGLVLVLIVLALFLRPIVAIWVAMGIAISFLGTFIFMPTLDVSLNFLSLFGLLLVIGIVVDDALVVGESIHRQTERGQKGLTAAVVGTQIVAKPVLFAVLTTMIAFAPFILIGGGTAQFTKHIAWTINLSLAFSLLESFLILPSHLSHMKAQEKQSRFDRFQSRFADGMTDFADKVYRPIIRGAIRWRYYTVAGFVVLFALSMSLLTQGWVPFNFMPDVEGRGFTIDVTMQEGTPYARNVEVYERMVGAMEEAQRLYEEELGQDIVHAMLSGVSETNIDARMILIDGNDRPVTTSQVAERVRELIGEIPDSEVVTVNSSASGDENAGRLYISLEGDNLDELAAAAEDMKSWLRTLPELYDVRDSLQAPNDELQLKLRPGAERFGLTLQSVIGQVRQAYYGEEVQRLPRDGEDVRVMVRYPRSERENLDNLTSVRIRTADGREVPLAAVAEEDFAPALQRINRRDRQQSVSVFAKISAGAPQGEIYGALYSEFVPGFTARHPTVQLAERGARQDQNEFFGQVFVLYAIALFCMYMLLAIAFGSYFQPILIMSAIPFGFMGAVFGHLLWGIPFAMFSVFGVAAAGGVVVNDNLVLIDYVNRLRQEGAGAFAALVEAGVVRFRPIILTSVTTFVGLIPILFESSVNAQFLKPMVVALAFGVFFALFVTLIFVPALYAVGADIARFYRALWTGEPQPSIGEGASREGLPVIRGADGYDDDLGAREPAE